MKNRGRGKKITSDDGMRNCLVPTWLIILRISLCGRSFWRWLFVSHCDWNNNDSSLVFLLFAERKRQKNMLFNSTGANPQKGACCYKVSEVHLTCVLVSFDFTGYVESPQGDSLRCITFLFVHVG